MHPMLTIARRAAEEAGKVVKRGYRDASRLHFREKRIDFARAVNQSAEQAIRQILNEKYPDYDIIGQEYDDQSVQTTESEYQWLITAIDGGENFLRGLPHFAVSIAASKQGKLEIGLVYNPLTEDWFLAARGQGSQLNGQRIRTNTIREPARAMIATHFTASDYSSESARTHSVLQNISELRCLGAASLDLCFVACGRLDGYFASKLNNWDIAAAVLIAQESGVIVSDYEGNNAMLETGTVIAANAQLHPSLKKMIHETQITATAAEN